jgi:hypothetical protein
LNFRYLVAALYLLGHPLRGRLGVLGALNIGRYIKGYSDVLSLYIILSESFTRHELPALLGTPLVYGHMEKKLANETCDVRVYGASVIFIRMALLLRVVRALLFIK